MDRCPLALGATAPVAQLECGWAGVPRKASVCQVSAAVTLATERSGLMSRSLLGEISQQAAAAEDARLPVLYLPPYHASQRRARDAYGH